MVAAKDVAETVKWGDILARVSEELDAAERAHIWGELNIVVKFENGVPTAEKIGVVKSRQLKKP